jgi:hypothetical protein
MTNNLAQEFSNVVSQFIGLVCWNVSAGAGTGSRFTLDCGRKIARSKRVNNPFLSEIARDHFGEHSIFVEDCAWRLESLDNVLCTSKSPNDHSGEMITGLAHLVNKRIIGAKNKNIALDLILEFESNFTLHIFSDCHSSVVDGDNYSVHSKDKVFSVSDHGRIVCESRAQPTGNRRTGPEHEQTNG